MFRRKARLFFSTSRCELQRKVTRQLSKSINQKLPGTGGLSEESNIGLPTLDSDDFTAPPTATWESRENDSSFLEDNNDGKRPYLHRCRRQPTSLTRISFFHHTHYLHQSRNAMVHPKIILSKRAHCSKHVHYSFYFLMTPYTA